MTASPYDNIENSAFEFNTDGSPSFEFELLRLQFGYIEADATMRVRAEYAAAGLPPPPEPARVPLRHWPIVPR